VREDRVGLPREGQTLIGDKNYFGREFEQQLAELDIDCCVRPENVRPSGPDHSCSSL
jgi:hypothetical protein